MASSSADTNLAIVDAHIVDHDEATLRQGMSSKEPAAQVSGKPAIRFTVLHAVKGSSR